MKETFENNMTLIKMYILFYANILTQSRDSTFFNLVVVFTSLPWVYFTMPHTLDPNVAISENITASDP